MESKKAPVDCFPNSIGHNEYFELYASYHKHIEFA